MRLIFPKRIPNDFVIWVTCPGTDFLFANAAVLVRLVKESACEQGSVLEVMIVISLDLSH